jgi:hypothetical protein
VRHRDVLHHHASITLHVFIKLELFDTKTILFGSYDFVKAKLPKPFPISILSFS